MSNVNNCLELTRAELDLVILANIQAVAKIDLVGEKRKERSDSSQFMETFHCIFFFFKTSAIVFEVQFLAMN